VTFMVMTMRINPFFFIVKFNEAEGTSNNEKLSDNELTGQMT